jgi:hypothetical protein
MQTRAGTGARAVYCLSQRIRCNGELTKSLCCSVFFPSHSFCVPASCCFAITAAPSSASRAVVPPQLCTMTTDWVPMLLLGQASLYHRKQLHQRCLASPATKLGLLPMKEMRKDVQDHHHRFLALRLSFAVAVMPICANRAGSARRNSSV